MAQIKKKKNTFKKLFWKLKKLIRLCFLPIVLPFKILRFLIKSIIKIVNAIRNHPSYIAFKKVLNVALYPLYRLIGPKTRRKLKAEAKYRLNHSNSIAEVLVDVLGGIDNILSISSASQGIIIKVEIEFLVELERLGEFGIIWNQLENGTLTMAFGFNSRVVAFMLQRYIKITQLPPKIRKSFSAPIFTFADFVKAVKDGIVATQNFAIKMQDKAIKLKDQIINFKDKTIVWTKATWAKFKEWLKKQKEARKLRKIRRQEERKRKKLDRAKQRKANKLASAARKKQKLMHMKQQKLKQNAMRKQKQAERMRQAKTRQSQKMSAQKAKMQSRKASQQRKKGRPPAKRTGKPRR